MTSDAGRHQAMAGNPSAYLLAMAGRVRPTMLGSNRRLSYTGDF